jgi:hypothetical protein
MVARMFKIITVLMVIAVLFAGQAYSFNLFPNLGDERVGTSSMQFLKLGAGARAAALGNSVGAMTTDGYSLYWNPAGFIWGGEKQLALSHNYWVVDVNYDFVGYGMRLNDDQAIGVSMLYLGTDKMNVTDEYHPYGNGQTFGYADVAFGLTYSRRLTGYFSFGATVKYAQENIENLTTRGYLLDMGTYYQMDYRRTRFAVTLTNFGQQIGPEGSYIYTNLAGEQIEKSYQTFSPPTTFRLALATDIMTTDINMWQVSFQLDHPTDNAEYFSLGTEYGINDIVFLRSGYKFNSDTQSFSIGGGLKVNILSTEAMLDYAFITVGDLGNSNMFSFHWSF